MQVSKPVAPQSLREALGRHEAAVTEAWRPETGTRSLPGCTLQCSRLFETAVIGLRAVDLDPAGAPRTRTRTVEQEVTRPTTVDTRPVLDWLQNKKRELTGVTTEGVVIGNQARLRHLKVLQAKIATLGDDVPYETTC